MLDLTETWLEHVGKGQNRQRRGGNNVKGVFGRRGEDLKEKNEGVAGGGQQKERQMLMLQMPVCK